MNDQERVLLVEGKDDQHVMLALSEAHNLPEVFSIRESGGIDALLDAIPVWLKSSELQRLAAIFDADVDVQARWQQFRQRVASIGITSVPIEPSAGGTIIRTQRDVRLGVWLMPNNRLPGILEDFLAFLIDPGDRLLPLVDDLLNSLGERCLFSPQLRPKARIHAWLALQESPGRPLGQAITARYLNAQASELAPLISWLKAVLVD